MSNNKFKIGSGQIENIFNLDPTVWINIFTRVFWVRSAAFAGDFYQHYVKVTNYQTLTHQCRLWEEDIYPKLLEFGSSIQMAGYDIPNLITLIDMQQPGATPDDVLDDIKTWIDDLAAQSKYLKPMIAAFLAVNRDADSNVARAKGFNADWCLGANHNQLEAAISTVQDHFDMIVSNIGEFKTWWDMSAEDISINEIELLKEDLAQASKEWAKTAAEVTAFMNPAKRIDEQYYYQGDFIYDFYPIDEEAIFNLSIRNPTHPDKSYLTRQWDPERRVWLESELKATSWQFKRAFSGWYYIVDVNDDENHGLTVYTNWNNWYCAMPYMSAKTDQPKPVMLWRVVPAYGHSGPWSPAEFGSVRLVNMFFGEYAPFASGPWIDYRKNDPSFGNLTSYIRVHIYNLNHIKPIYADWQLTTVGTRSIEPDLNGIWNGRTWSTDAQGNAIDYDTDSNALLRFEFWNQGGQDIDGRYTLTSGGEVDSQGTVYLNMNGKSATGQIVDDERINLATTSYQINGRYMTGFFENEDNENEVSYGRFRLRRDH